MKKLLATLALATLALTTFADTVKIGVILPLSGPVAFMGQEEMAGLKTLQADLEVRNTIHKYEFVIEDDQLTPKIDAQAVRKLIDVDHVDAIVPTFGAAANIAKPFCEKAKVIMVGNMASDETIANSSYCFNNAPRPATVCKPYVETLKALGVGKLAIISVVHPSSYAIVEALKEQLSENGVSLVSNIFYNPGEKDFRTIWLKTRESHPDMVLLLSFSQEFELLLVQQTQIAPTLPISGLEYWTGYEYLPKLQGKWFVASGTYTSEYVQKQKAAVPSLNKYPMGAYTYDSLNLIVNAYEKSSQSSAKPSTEIVADSMRSLPYQGALGTITCEVKGTFDSPVALWYIENNEATQIDVSSLKDKLNK